MSCGIITFSSARELGQEVMELIDEADLHAADGGALAVGEAARLPRPATSTSPASGRSSSPAMWRSVDLPAPDGATSATISPG